ncbi:MAG: GDP-mannose 4,6-dehydratase, partial [Lentisphaerae bacterium]|nr:GDP-mannose 4,6-dehydratase [Lentisphaerota bacterium]
MRVLVTGAAGFAGRYAARELHAHGHAVTGLDLAFDEPVARLDRALSGDLGDADRLAELVGDAAPEACLHLAALSSVPDGDAAPERAFAVNVIGTDNLLAALARHAPACRVLAVSTAHVYGRSRGDMPLNENAPLLPDTVYAVSKAAMELAARGAAARSGLPLLIARPNNHTGPGQSARFVVPALVAQAAAIRDGTAEPVLRLGNLDSVREFADVRDVVRAYRLLLEAGRPGEAYNIGGGQRLTIRELVQTVCRLAGVQP